MFEGKKTAMDSLRGRRVSDYITLFLASASVSSRSESRTQVSANSGRCFGVPLPQQPAPSCPRVLRKAEVLACFKLLELGGMSSKMALAPAFARVVAGHVTETERDWRSSKAASHIQTQPPTNLSCHFLPLQFRAQVLRELERRASLPQLPIGNTLTRYLKQRTHETTCSTALFLFRRFPLPHTSAFPVSTLKGTGNALIISAQSQSRRVSKGRPVCLFRDSITCSDEG